MAMMESVYGMYLTRVWRFVLVADWLVKLMETQSNFPPSLKLRSQVGFRF